MNLFPAQSFDIDAIMRIERQAFIPSIQEKKSAFEKRIKVFQQGFPILCDCGEKNVKENGGALVCGYFCSEIWDSMPQPSDSDKVFSRRFALGHNIKDTHSPSGKYLYVSSFALLREYQGKGLGKKFFESAVASLCGAFPLVDEVVLLVDSEWTGARSIYDSLGFSVVRVLPGFFPTLTKKVFADGIVMKCPAGNFRSIEFPNEKENELAGIVL